MVGCITAVAWAPALTPACYVTWESQSNSLSLRFPCFQVKIIILVLPPSSKWSEDVVKAVSVNRTSKNTFKENVY